METIIETSSFFSNISYTLCRYHPPNSIYNCIKSIYKCFECLCKYFFHWTLHWGRRFWMFVCECVQREYVQWKYIKLLFFLPCAHSMLLVYISYCHLYLWNIMIETTFDLSHCWKIVLFDSHGCLEYRFQKTPDNIDCELSLSKVCNFSSDYSTTRNNKK